MIEKVETFIREAFIKKEHLTGIFFDLKKAYDSTWKYGIMSDLHNLSLPGFLNNFLLEINFKVCVEYTLSDFHNQVKVILLGSIFMVTIFSIKISRIIKFLNPGIDSSLYVDDLIICYRSKYIHMIE